MPNLKGEIKDFVAGDNLDITKTIIDIPSGQTLTKAWFTVKVAISSLDSAATFQKTVTSVNTPGQGVILDDGSGDGIGQVRFELTNANTALLAENAIYQYDIQVLTSASKVYTPERGIIKAKGEVTKSTS